jgi:hypothetical protein
MDMIAAYFTFLLILIASGLAVICLGVFSIALCEATS